MNVSRFTRRLASTAALVAGLLLLPASLHAQDTTTTQTPPPQMQEEQAATLVATLEERGNFTTLVGALESTGLAEQLSGTRAYTIFAPTDAAFGQLPSGTLDSMSSEQLRRILRYHVVSESVMAADITSGAQLKAAQGGMLTFEQSAGSVAVNGTPISEADVETANGVIHVIDGVLMPESAASGQGGGMSGGSGAPVPPDTSGNGPRR